MVTSTDSGLAVPDWPLSYGTLFPPMVGGVFYEHGHRMVAAGVGLLTLCLVVWLGLAEKRRWVRALGISALATIVAQGVLGGITVLFLLPTLISVTHAVLAHTFFVLIILLAYSQSVERQSAQGVTREIAPAFLRLSFLLSVLIYLQLILGAWMRHTGSGFVIHLIQASAIVVVAGLLTALGIRTLREKSRTLATLLFLDLLLMTQMVLGVLTVVTEKAAIVASLHVVTGAALLGMSVLLFLRLAPLSFKETKRLLFGRPRQRSVLPAYFELSKPDPPLGSGHGDDRVLFGGGRPLFRNALHHIAHRGGTYLCRILRIESLSGT